MFEHPDWHEFDRGTSLPSDAVRPFREASGRTPEEVRELMRATAESLRPIEGTMRLLEDLAAAGMHLYLLSNMPVSTFNFLVEHHSFFAPLQAPGDFRDDPAAQAGAGDLQAPGREHRHRARRKRVHRRPARNVIAARECGLHAIQFTNPASLPRELRGYLPHAGL